MPSPTGRIVTTNQVLLNAKAATGVSTTPLNVADFTSIIVAVTAPLNSTLTFKFQGSIGKSVTDSSAPDFSATQSATNQWDYVSAYDYNDPTTLISGDTGVSIDNLAEAANTRLYTINVSLLRWFSMSVTAYTDGSLTSWAMLAS